MPKKIKKKVDFPTNFQMKLIEDELTVFAMATAKTEQDSVSAFFAGAATVVLALRIADTRPEFIDIFANGLRAAFHDSDFPDGFIFHWE